MTSPPDDLHVGVLDRWPIAFDERRTVDLPALCIENAAFQGISSRLLVDGDELSCHHAVADRARPVVEVLPADQLGEESSAASRM